MTSYSVRLYVGVDVRVKLGDSKSNRSRDIQAAQFVMDERRRRRPTNPVAIRQNAKWRKVFCLISVEHSIKQ